MNPTLALVPSSVLAPVRARWGSLPASTLAVLMGVTALSALAQVSIPLPFTPVPITGQTFGVTLISLLLGSRHALAAVAAYLALGAAGAPVFAGGVGALTLGPTSGYLVGMLGASWIVGRLADRGFGRSFGRAMLAGYAGSACVFAFGVAGLVNFIPASQVLQAGVLPFLPGDLIKTALAAWVVSGAHRAKRSA